MASAESIAKALGGRKTGGSWMARCPAHDDREPSLSIAAGHEGKVLLRCHAGCDQAKVIQVIRAQGLWTHQTRHDPQRHRFERCNAVENSGGHDDAKRTETALGIWRSSVSVLGTLVETYLNARGLQLHLSASLRFHAGLKHPLGGVWPAMVALVTRGSDDTPLAIHRTFLARDGSGKAPVDPQKMMLGPCRGGTVRLGMPADMLMVGEGIETCLAAMQATRTPAWAALSTSGLLALDLPGVVREVIVLADGDDPGEAAARNAALRWKREGRHVRIARPPKGSDFNDLLLVGTPKIEESGA